MPAGRARRVIYGFDHLGSVRLVMDQNGNVVGRHDYLPYGEEVPAGTAGRNGPFGTTHDTAAKFTGQLRDGESGMDYFNARNLTPALGRFMSPDPGSAGASLTDPQSWNGYAYVRNSPLHMVDPSGLSGFGGNGGDDGGDPCIDDPFACGFPIDFPFPGPVTSEPAPPPPTQTEGMGGGWPRGSFPGGESLGLPPGTNLPGPFGGLSNPFIFSLCGSAPQICADPSIWQNVFSLARYGPWIILAGALFGPTPMTDERRWEITQLRRSHFPLPDDIRKS